MGPIQGQDEEAVYCNIEGASAETEACVVVVESAVFIGVLVAFITCVISDVTDDWVTAGTRGQDTVNMPSCIPALTSDC
jgi:hypothetical protein